MLYAWKTFSRNALMLRFPDYGLFISTFISTFFFLLCSFLYKTFSDSSTNGGIQGKFRSFIDPVTFLYSTISHTSTEGFEICMSGIVFNRDNYSQFLGWRKLSLCQLFQFGLISSSLVLWSWRFGPFRFRCSSDIHRSAQPSGNSYLTRYLYTFKEYINIFIVE